MWLAEAEAWIREEAARIDAQTVDVIEQTHVRPWSTVLRARSQRGDLYFKANASQLRHEAALVSLLAERRPDCVSPLLAADVERGWMLMSDAGIRLREIVQRERDLSPWLEILPLYAGLQIDLASDAEAIVALGVPDLRLANVPTMYEALLDSLAGLPPNDRSRLVGNVSRVREMCDELRGYVLPETIQHDDLHDGQVFVRDGRYRILDWGDACVSHPFFTLSVTLEGTLAWGIDDVQGSVQIEPFRDAYLAPFARLDDRRDLDTACTTALRLGWVCRAINCHLAGSEAAETHVQLRMFLDGAP
jgi:hypothetical protein